MSNLTLPTIQASLGVKISAEFIEKELGVAPAATDKRAKFFTREQYDEIRKKLSAFVRDRTEIIEGERPVAKPKAGNAPAPSPTPAPAPAYQDDDEF